MPNSIPAIIVVHPNSPPPVFDPPVTADSIERARLAALRERLELDAVDQLAVLMATFGAGRVHRWVVNIAHVQGIGSPCSLPQRTTGE